jgi:hypothetical protein
MSQQILSVEHIRARARDDFARRVTTCPYEGHTAAAEIWADEMAALYGVAPHVHRVTTPHRQREAACQR